MCILLLVVIQRAFDIERLFRSGSRLGDSWA